MSNAPSQNGARLDQQVSLVNIVYKSTVYFFISFKRLTVQIPRFQEKSLFKSQLLFWMYFLIILTLDFDIYVLDKLKIGKHNLSDFQFRLRFLLINCTFSKVHKNCYLKVQMYEIRYLVPN